MGHSSRSSSTFKNSFQTFKSFTPIQHTTRTGRMKLLLPILIISLAALCNARVAERQKPGQKIVEVPVEKTIEKRVEKAVEVPVERLVERGVQVPVARVVKRTVAEVDDFPEMMLRAKAAAKKVTK